MRQARVLGWIVGGCAVLLVVCLLAVWLLINPSRYKPQIVSAVEHATGRKLQLTGEIKLSVLPWIALELGPASLGNPPGFSEQPFVSFSHAAMRVKLLPLLRTRLEISRIEIDGLDLRLQRNAEGKGNWQDVGPTPALPETAAAPEHMSALQSMQSLADVKIRHGRLSYQNLVVKNLELETGSMGRSNVPISISFDANRGTANEQLTVIAKFDLSEAAALDRLRLAALNVSGTMSRQGDGRPVHWEIAAPALDVDFKQQTVQTPAFAINYSSARVTGSFAATHILDTPRGGGSLNLGPLVLHEFMQRLGISLPQTRDAKALADLSGSTDFTFDTSGLSLEKIQFRLDDTQLKGQLNYLTQGTGSLKFDLSIDQLDLNRYLAPSEAGRRESSGASATSNDTSSPAVNGVLRVAALKISALDFTELGVTVASDHGVTRLFPIQASIDGGRYSGNITYDAHGAVPSLALDEHLAGVDMLRMLANTPQRGRISGQATVDLKGSAHGATADSLLKSLDGQFDANLAHGAIEGVDVGYEVSLAQSLFDRRAPSARQDAKRTRFDAFRMSAQISNGVAQTRDLVISSDVLKVTGQGTANLPTKAIDFALAASILTSNADTGVEIPLKITGTYADPTIRPDADAVAKGQLKQKLQDVLKKNGLQGLFGR